MKQMKISLAMPKHKNHELLGMQLMVLLLIRSFLAANASMPSEDPSSSD